MSGLMWKEGEQTDMRASSCHPCSQYSRKAAVPICLFPFLVMLDEIWLSLKTASVLKIPFGTLGVGDC